MAAVSSGLKDYLEGLYARHQRAELISPDPLQFVRAKDVSDREIEALVASSLAYGRVAMILRSVGTVLSSLGKSPRAAVEGTSLDEWRERFSGFKHRFTDGDDVAHLLFGVRCVVEEFGSMQACLLRGRGESGSLVGGLEFLVRSLSRGRENSLLALPSKGSACKRHFLMLRWLVRCDAVDPGGWSGVNPSELLVPLDVHMYQVCGSIGFTSRKSADLKTAREITSHFARLCPNDPVKYDFVLTRFGIRPDMRQSDVIEGANSAIHNS